MFQPIAYDQWLWRKESRGLNWSRQDISALDLQCLPPGSGHGSPKRGITRLYGRIFPERFVTKNSYQPSIKIIVSCGAFKTASSVMVRSVHGTHPLNYQTFKHYNCICHDVFLWDNLFFQRFVRPSRAFLVFLLIENLWIKFLPRVSWYLSTFPAFAENQLVQHLFALPMCKNQCFGNFNGSKYLEHR